MTLKERLLAIAASPSASPPLAGSIDAPELGDGEKLYFRTVSLGERMTVIDAGKDEALTPLQRQVRVLSIMLANADGSRAFPPPLTEQCIDPREEPFHFLQHLPAPLADRAMKAVGRFMTDSGTIDEGKASSATTPTSDS